jgi:hypothetical protein
MSLILATKASVEYYNEHRKDFRTVENTAKWYPIEKLNECTPGMTYLICSMADETIS